MFKLKNLLFFSFLIIGGICTFGKFNFSPNIIILVSTFLLFIGLYVLLYGGNLLVDGSTSIAKKFSIPPIVIGLTIMAFGTSMPEFFVSILAALNGQADIMLSNVIGSNIVNILFILGVSAMIFPLAVNSNTLHKEIPFSLLAVIALLILVNDAVFGGNFDVLNKADGLILLLFFGVFMYYVFTLVKNGNTDGLEDIRSYSTFSSISFLFFGVLGLYIGGDLIVTNASFLAEKLGMSKILIGATIVAVGTSLPELVASVIAALRKQADMAVGNVIGSNIFNIFWIAGLTSVITNVNYDKILNLDTLFLLIITMLLFVLVVFKKSQKITKYEGTLFVLLYIGYLSFLIIRG